MKILHTADWHLGKRLNSYNRHDEQKIVLNEICEIAERENVDVVVIAGDIFDTFNPPNESISLFYKTCKRLSNNGLRPIIAIAGNHDSPERIEAPNPLAIECGILFAGYPKSVLEPYSLPNGFALTYSSEGFIELKLPHYDYPLRILLAPYANEYRLAEYLGVDNTDENLRYILSEKWSKVLSEIPQSDGFPNKNWEESVNIAIAHLFVMEKGGVAPEEPEEERPINVGGASAIYTENFPPVLQYIALGHLHRQQEISDKPCPVIYCGSPLGYSFNEKNQDKYVMLVEAEPAQKVNYQRIRLETPKKLYQATFYDINSAIEWFDKHPDALIQLSFITDEALSPILTKQLFEAHQGIIPPINFQSSYYDGQVQPVTNINPDTDDINSLFIEYFKIKYKGQEPNTELIQLFTEIRAVNEQAIEE